MPRWRERRRPAPHQRRRLPEGSGRHLHAVHAAAKAERGADGLVGPSLRRRRQEEEVGVLARHRAQRVAGRETRELRGETRELRGPRPIHRADRQRAAHRAVNAVQPEVLGLRPIKLNLVELLESTIPPLGSYQHGQETTRRTNQKHRQHNNRKDDQR